jgi:hypothetical protein
MEWKKLVHLFFNFLQLNKRVKFFVDTILKSNELFIKFFEMGKNAHSQLGHLMSYDVENS